MKRALSAHKRFALAKEIAELEHRNTIISDKGIIESIFIKNYGNPFDNLSGTRDLDALDDLLSRMPRLPDTDKKKS